MTAVFSRSKARRAAALGAVSLGLVSLSACEKPTPMVTVTAGSSSVSDEATCYRDGKKLSDKRLRTCIGERSKKSDKKLSVEPGERVRIGVDPTIAKAGWALLVDGRGAMSEAGKNTYQSFAHDTIFQAQQTPLGMSPAPKTVRITVVEVSAGGEVRGTWSFRLKRSS